MGKQVTNKLTDIIDKCCYFSLHLDESTDQTYTSQLLIFIRATQSDFSTKEELLELCSLHGNTEELIFMNQLKNLCKNLVVLINAPVLLRTERKL
jgi:hypothetical protein